MVCIELHSLSDLFLLTEICTTLFLIYVHVCVYKVPASILRDQKRVLSFLKLELETV